MTRADWISGGLRAFSLSFLGSHVAFPFYFCFFKKKWIFKVVYFEQLWANIDQTHGGGGTSENKETEESQAA